MINFLRKSLSIEIENFVKYMNSISNRSLFPSFTKSAFVQCRHKIQPEVFKHLSSRLIEEFYTDNDASVKLWKGFRLLSVDGSRMTLPNTKDLELEYGKTKNQSDTGVVQARVSVLYDVLNHYVIDGILSPLKIGENALAIQHLDLARKGDLIIYDRGYPSFRLVYEHYRKELDFLIRVKKEFNNATLSFYQSGKKSEIVKIQPGKNTKITDKPYNRNSFEQVRLLRIDLPSGNTEILMTSLKNKKQYPDAVFKQLYSKRWGVELFYDELKNKLKAEHFSGYSKQCILQDFYAALFVSNVQSLIVGELNDELSLDTKTKYKYKVNNNLSYGLLKDRIITLLFSGTDTDIMLNELKALFKKHLVPIRPNRSNPRKIGKYRPREKPKVLKNQKDAI